jgi:putative nucleotidyltransferase with HDIG domain
MNRLIKIIMGIAGGDYSDDIRELTGPETEEPLRTIAEALRAMLVKIKAREYNAELMSKQVQEANQRIRRNIIATVTTMAKAFAARDAYTEGHAERVGQISGLIAAATGMSKEDVKLVQVAGLLHDIGKIGFPDYLFLPHEGNTPKEIIREITRHPTTGAEILKDLDFLGPALSYIRYHHERPDGFGYPQLLKGDDIPLGARIISVADAFDAIATDRPYQKGRTFKEALAILKEGAGTKWDPQCVDAFERILPKIPCHTENLKSPKEMLLCLSDNQTEIVLEPGPVGGARMRWLKPGIDFSKYNRLMLDRAIFFFAEDSEYKGMDPHELKELGDLFYRQLKETLKGKYPIVKNPGSDVARIGFAITDLRQNRPVLSDMGPIGIDLSDLKMNPMRMVKS